MKSYVSLLLSFLFASCALSQPKEAFPLWPKAAPGALGKAEQDIPTLKPFFPKPDKATGAAMVICPGGGYGGLEVEREGEAYALWLNDHGIAGFILKYRLGGPTGYHHPMMLWDAARAVRLVRAKATDWKLDPKRIGIIGSSSGGHLASTLLTHFDAGKPDDADPVERQSSRPDIGVLCYPVITMGAKTHADTRENLLGKHPPPELIQLLSNELHVTKDTPPCFLFHTCEDVLVPMENSLAFATALRQAGVPFDLHIYEKGQHGMGLGGASDGSYDATRLHPWTRDCMIWLKVQGFVK